MLFRIKGQSLISGNLPEPKQVNSKVEQLKKRPAARPNWNDLMEEIGSYKNSYGKLKKVQTNDRSKPILATTKIGKSVRKKINTKLNLKPLKSSLFSVYI